MNDLQIVGQSIQDLPAYATVPIAFEVRSMLDVQPIDNGLGGFTFTERPVVPPYVKDYDSYPDERPTRWPELWDISNWGILAAFLDGSRAGGCAIAHHTPKFDRLEGRKDIALIQDLRVAPAHRGQGIGAALFQAAAAWAARRHCRLLKVETQNINVPACRLYARQGCALTGFNRRAYPDFPGEIELFWAMQLLDNLT